jgi:hypothetical protein
MGRRKKHETVIAGAAVTLFAVIALCCGGPIAFINSLSVEKIDVAQTRTELTAKQVLRPNLVASAPAEQPFQYRPNQVLDTPSAPSTGTHQTN